MPFTSIISTQTQANAVINQVLMDAIRENLDYLHAISSQMINVNGSDSGSGTTITSIINSDIDWRDRNIGVLGGVAGIYVFNDQPAALALVQAILPGGTEDDEMFSDSNGGSYGAPGGVQEYDFPNAFIYSKSGSITYNTKPYIRMPGQTANATITNFYIWVDSSNGNLMITTVTANGNDGKAHAWNLQITYSEVQGGY